jgi:pyruvate dehydrogenase E1 component alpha subunit
VPEDDSPRGVAVSEQRDHAIEDALPAPKQSVAGPRELTPWSLLGVDGTPTEGYEPSLSPDELLSAFRLMLLSRQVDERAFSLQRQGRLGTFSQTHGQEASVVGSAWALDPRRDWIVPQYRELGAMLHHGYPLERFLLYFMGNPVGNQMPEGVNVLPFQISLAAQIPHAVGLAWGLRAQGQDAVVMTYFGDGASSEGDAHEAMNLAGVRRAPVVFWLQNNGWAISTPVSRQTAASSFALRAPGYGFPGILVDGNDLFATYEAARWAVARARGGLGPTLIESRTYRLGAHNTSDDPTRYVPATDLEAKAKLEPIARLRAYLRAKNLIDESEEEDLREQLSAEVNAAVTAAEQYPKATVAQIFEHVYATAPARVSAQRASVPSAES